MLGSNAFAPTKSLTYYCDQGQLAVLYASDTIAVKFPNETSLTLAHTPSADGARYEASTTVFWSKGNNAFVTEGGSIAFNNCVAGTVTTSGDTSIFTDATNLFSFSFPSKAGVVISGGDGSYTQSWRANATTSGMLLAKGTLLSSFEPNTNLAISSFTVGASSDPSSLSSCVVATNGEKAATSTATINGVTYTVFTLGDAGAGNFYDTTSYRTVKDNECYAIEYTIHSLNLGNFDPSQNITAFDKEKVRSVFDGMVQSFKFLQ